MNPFSGLSDEELMVKYQLNEYQAFEVLYQRHRERVFSYLKKRVFDQQKLDDLFQGIFLKLHKCRHLYRKEHLFIAWLYTICRSELIDFFRKNKLQIPTSLGTDSLISDDHNDNSYPDLPNMDGLSQNEKQAVELRFLSEKEYDEISEILKVNPSNARKLVSRGIGKLRLKTLGVRK